MMVGTGQGAPQPSLHRRQFTRWPRPSQHIGVLGRSGTRLAAFSPVLRAASGRRMSSQVLAMARKDKKKDEGGEYAARHHTQQQQQQQQQQEEQHK